jgi:hypothetical protein
MVVSFEAGYQVALGRVEQLRLEARPSVSSTR